MYIKRLVLENFKSFGRRTELPFHDDFTTVSGPNGSGKSNIIDAILFALGLARTRGMRAQKLTDLIYNPGHEGGEEEDPDRPKEAFVEVTLDNSDRTLTRAQVESAAGTKDIGDVDEITVRRRVKRTDENYYSYYYLNERSVNLSDIQGLLSQAGVAPEGYNVVMQGDVTGIINMTPYRRREIIDEIAGVAEFDEKREAALEELETVKDRIEEADLRIEEKEARLEQLEDERETALRYQELRDERAEYETFRQAAELEDKRERLDRLEDERDELEEQLADERATLDTYEGRLDRLQEELTELNAEIERTGEEEQLRVKREIEGIKGAIDRLEDRIEAAEDRIQEAEGTRRQAFVRIDQTQERIEELQEDIRETKLEKVRIKGEIDELEDERAELEAEIEETDTEYESLRDDLQDAKEHRQAIKEEKHEYQREQDRLLDEARRRSEEIEDIESEIAAAEGNLERLERDLDDLRAEHDRAIQNREQIQSVIDDLTASREELQDELSRIEDDLDAAKQEYADLEVHAQANGDDSYGRAVTTILNADIEGVHGTVGQLGGVEAEYAAACETAGGGRLANVVVDDDDVGSRCIDHLKARNAGRATFLPITKMDRRSLPSVPDHDGVIDFAYNLVDFDDAYEDVFSYVLGSTLVVDTMDTARELMGRYRLVTLEGDLVEKSGAMTGGSRSGSRYSFSKTGKGRLERVAERIAALEEERQETQAEIETIEDRLDSARDRRADATEQVREIGTELDSLENREAEIEARIETLASRLSEKQAERDGVDERMNELSAEMESADQRIAEIDEQVADIEAELADSRIPELSARIEDIDTAIAEKESEMTDLDGRLNELDLEIQYAESTIEDLHEEIETAQNRKADEEESIEEFEAEIEEHEVELAERRETVEALEEELSSLKDERQELEAEIAETTESRNDQRATVVELENAAEDRADAAAELAEEIDALAEEVSEYDREDLPDHETVLEEIERLTEAMEELEPVNMLAVDEYDAVNAELSTLTERRGILADERQEIIDRIDSYETQKKETFMEAFDGINEHFEEIFQRLSAGSGTLHLEDAADPFEGGLTMEAQPADKPIQRLEAMSGGEKSLTALAFIFAIQRYNPAPFYALDEIDAFLDAVNADRVGEMVDELAERAQFVVVSHRAAMLDRSSRAIGVTMQEDNLSAVTGIDLEGGEPEVPADD